MTSHATMRMKEVAAPGAAGASGLGRFVAPGSAVALGVIPCTGRRTDPDQHGASSAFRNCFQLNANVVTTNSYADTPSRGPDGDRELHGFRQERTCGADRASPSTE